MTRDNARRGAEMVVRLVNEKFLSSFPVPDIYDRDFHKPGPFHSNNKVN